MKIELRGDAGACLDAAYADADGALCDAIEDALDLIEDGDRNARAHGFRLETVGAQAITGRAWLVPFRCRAEQWAIVWIESPTGTALILAINRVDDASIFN